MSRRHFRFTARIALAVMLFSAISPALAAALFSDRPQILRKMLALPEPIDSKLEQHAEHGHGIHSGQSSSDDDHQAHGVFCSFCLSASSVVALPSPGDTASVIALFPTIFWNERRDLPSGSFVAPYRSRAPPIQS